MCGLPHGLGYYLISGSKLSIIHFFYQHQSFPSFDAFECFFFSNHKSHNTKREQCVYTVFIAGSQPFPSQTHCPGGLECGRSHRLSCECSFTHCYTMFIRPFLFLAVTQCLTCPCPMAGLADGVSDGCGVSGLPPANCQWTERGKLTPMTSGQYSVVYGGLS